MIKNLNLAYEVKHQNDLLGFSSLATLGIFQVRFSDSLITIGINILLKFLVYTIVYIKRNRQDVSNEDNSNEENEELEDMTNIRSKIKDLTDKGVIDRVERGLPVPTKDFRVLENIKKEFDSYFDKDSGNTLKEGLQEVDEYLEGEIENLSQDNPTEGSNNPEEDSNIPDENESKKRRVEDTSDLPIEMPSIFDDVD